MRRVNHALPIGNVVDLMHKDRSLFCQLIHNIAVMDNLPAYINRRAESLQCDLHNVNRAHHTGAKAPWLEQQDPLLAGGSLGLISVRDGVEDSCSHITQYSNRCTEKTAK